MRSSVWLYPLCSLFIYAYDTLWLSSYLLILQLSMIVSIVLWLPLQSLTNPSRNICLRVQRATMYPVVFLSSCVMLQLLINPPLKSSNSQQCLQGFCSQRSLNPSWICCPCLWPRWTYTRGHISTNLNEQRSYSIPIEIDAARSLVKTKIPLIPLRSLRNPFLLRWSRPRCNFHPSPLCQWLSSSSLIVLFCK